jgi:hypothetical protein
VQYTQACSPNNDRNLRFTVNESYDGSIIAGSAAGGAGAGMTADFVASRNLHMLPRHDCCCRWGHSPSVLRE